MYLCVFLNLVCLNINQTGDLIIIYNLFSQTTYFLVYLCFLVTLTSEKF